MIFIKSLLATVVSILIAHIYFFEWRIAASSGLISVALYEVMTRLLSQNREAIWNLKQNPWKANYELAIGICLLFFGMLSASLLMSYLGFGEVKAASEINERYRNELYPLFQHNLNVLLAGCLLSVIYQSGGLIMVLAWNAQHWSSSFIEIFNGIKLQHGVPWGFISLLSISPHLLLEVVSYCLGGMAGIFLVRGSLRYSFLSAEYRRVGVAVFTIAVIAIGVLFFSALCEVFIAQAVIHPVPDS